ncbi:bifunctional molybdenum cofactor biosynthesis protein MoaC/MoaB [soil metagenome]
MDLLQHFFENAHYKMIAVGNKAVSKRIALATGQIQVNEVAFKHIQQNTLPKGNALALAEIAGIIGAKKVTEILPLCHPIPLEQVVIKSELSETDKTVRIFALVSATAKTGVEMEALSAVNAALLCIYDLCKMYGQDMVMTNSRLLYKEGGKGDKLGSIEHLPPELKTLLTPKKPLKGVRCAIITLSDRASQGEYTDRAGMYLMDRLSHLGSENIIYHCIADEPVQLRQQIDEILRVHQCDIIFTCGGTGIAPRDKTTDTIKPLLDYEIPGVAELLRIYGANFTEFSWLSRSVVGVLNNTLLITFPGSESGVKQGLVAIEKLLPHAICILHGGNHDQLP